MLNLLKNILKYSPAKVIVGLSNFMLIPLLTNNLSPSEFGLYSLFFSVATLIIAFSSGWITQATLRFYYNHENDRKDFVGTNITLILIINLFCASIILLASNLVNLADKYSFYLMLFFMIFIALRSTFNFLQTIVRNENKVIIYTIIDITLSIGTITLLYILLSRFDFKESSFFIASSLVLMVLVFYMILYLKISFKLKKNIVKKVAVYGIPLIFLSVLNWIMTMSDRIVIEIFSTTYELGIYAANYSLIERVLLFITSMLTVATGPLIMKTWTKKSKRETQELLKQIISVYFWITIPIVVLFVFFGKEIISMILGETYFYSQWILNFISIGVFFQGLSLFTFHPLLLFNKSKKYAIYTLYAAVLNIISNILFIQFFGILGASLATLMTFVFLYILSLISDSTDKLISIPIKSFLKTLGMSLITAGLMKLLTVFYTNNTLSFFMALVGCGVFYVIIMILIKEIMLPKEQ